MLVYCPVCGYEKQRGSTLEFCPNDGMRLVAKRGILNFEAGWKLMLEDLKEPKTFPTIGSEKTGRTFKTFTLQRKDNKIKFIHPFELSDCYVEKSELKRVYEHFKKTKSYKTTDYSHITFHASYFLRLIERYFIDP